MKHSLIEECIPLSVKTSSCTKCTKFSDVKMKCTQNLQNVAGDHRCNDLLYKLRQGKFELLVVMGGFTGSLKKTEENDYLEYIV